MKISAKMSIIMAAIFGGICFSVAIHGFIASGDIQDPVQRADGYGFAWFWAFLGLVAVIFGGIGVWIVKTYREDQA